LSDEQWDWLPYREGFALGHDEVERARYAGGTVTDGRRRLLSFEQVKGRLVREGEWTPEEMELLKQGYEDAIAGRRPRY
jgi:hypothetical protein